VAMSTALDDERLASGPASAALDGGLLGMLYVLWSERALRRAALLGLLMMAMNQLSGINAVMYYSGSIFERDFGREAAVWLAAACDLAQGVGVLICLLTIDSHGRRLVALRSACGVVLSLVGIVISYAVSFTGQRGMTVACMMAYLVSFGAGLSGVAWVLNSELHPMRVRAAAVAQATFVNWICNYGVSQSYLGLAGSIGNANVFGLYLSVAVLGGLAVYHYLPETSGLRLEEVERLFHEPYPQTVAVRTQPRAEGAALLGTPK